MQKCVSKFTIVLSILNIGLGMLEYFIALCANITMIIQIKYSL